MDGPMTWPDGPRPDNINYLSFAHLALRHVDGLPNQDRSSVTWELVLSELKPQVVHNTTLQKTHGPFPIHIWHLLMVRTNI
jgi:hypothetical protein